MKIFSFTSCKITLPARCPEEPDETIDHPLLEELVLLPGLDADQVHAVPPADVPPRQPVNLQVLGQLIFPGEEIVVALVFCMFYPENLVDENN